MKTILARFHPLSVILTIAIFLSSAAVYSSEQPGSPEKLDNIAPGQVDSVLAKLSDEQVRDLLIAELTENVQEEQILEKKGGTLFATVAGWLHIFDFENEEEVESNFQRLAGYIGELPGDLADAFRKLGGERGMGFAFLNFFFILIIFLAAFGFEFLFRGVTANYRKQFLDQAMPELSGYMRFLAGVLREIPMFVNLAVYLGVSFLLFIITPLYKIADVRYVFLALLFLILFARTGYLFSYLICSPNLASLRLLPVGDEAAQRLHRIMLIAFTYVGFAVSTIALVAELGIPQEALTLIIIFVGSVLLLWTAKIIFSNRQQIADYILSAETTDTGSNWVVRQFAQLWHIPAILYLFVIWVIFLFQQTLGIRHDKDVFLLSLLVLPIFLVLDRVGQWVVEMTVKTLKLYQDEEEENTEEKEEEGLNSEEKERLIIIRVGRIVRIFILIALCGWVMSMWGFEVPYITTVTQIVFRSLVTMALALIVWRIISSYIERKILEDEPDEPVEEDQDSEWGGAALRGRSYTLLPMVRKFLGSVLVVMVTLTVLSTIGIEIGPLLAGAGVVGLAIGFGAQKLVSDVFSGFFFLLDDAFRVGEYLEAGGVSGAVEGITLRNVLLRHHRGMLQIVPYSELGAITNYMRGGIVVKFNLEFPYDTDVDLVRRIIKKVGKAMLEDEDYGKDFIRPVKSQGVREITNSVMVIRVKFTAQPGTHFVIRREAYRRITEALAAKGIHYAHRKVIVEVPGAAESAEDVQKVAEAGAAAGLASIAQDEEKAKQAAASSADKPPGGMPGM